MTIKQIKSVAGNYENKSVWVSLRHEIYGTVNWRLIGIGRKYLRLMSSGGRVIQSVQPSMIIEIRS